MPSPGKVSAVRWPVRAVGARRHVARARRRGAAVLRLAAGKLIVWGPDRDDVSRAGAAGAAGVARRRGQDDGADARAAAGRGLVRPGRVPHDDVGGVAVMSRYSWGADEHLFVELAEEMSLQANFRAMAIATKLRERRPDGLLDICPANASYQVRFDPDVLAPADLESLLRGDRRGGRRRARVLARDAGRRGAGALRRPVDQRDADEVPRPPPGAGLDRPRVRGEDQRLLRQGRVHRRARGRAVVRLDGRVRRRAAVPLPDGPARRGSSRCRSTCARARTRRR